MTRKAAGLALALALAAGTAEAAVGLPAARLAPPAQAGAAVDGGLLHRVEYYCSPGFEPSYGGTCVAVPPRAEIELFVDQPIYATETIRTVRHHRRHRHGLRELY